jgi:hypothetical protein
MNPAGSSPTQKSFCSSLYFFLQIRRQWKKKKKTKQNTPQPFQVVDKSHSTRVSEAILCYKKLNINHYTFGLHICCQYLTYQVPLSDE